MGGIDSKGERSVEYWDALLREKYEAEREMEFVVMGKGRRTRKQVRRGGIGHIHVKGISRREGDG